MEKEDQERLVRVETKLDLFLPLLSDHTLSLQKHEKDINRGKGIVAFLVFLGTVLGLHK